METTNGIILRTYPYGDYNEIALVYTRKWGLLKFAIPYARSKNSRFKGLFSPLQEVELEFFLQHREIEKVKNAALLNPHIHLRESLSLLETASRMAKALLAFELPGVPGEELYMLFSAYLKLLHRAASPEALLASFRLKLLKHEGLLLLKESDPDEILLLALCKDAKLLLEILPQNESLKTVEELFSQGISGSQTLFST